MHDPRPYDILVVGEVNPDLVLTGDVTPAFGQVEKLVDDASLTIGSSACIFAVGAARLGLRVLFVGKIGPDEFGQYMRGAMQAEGVDMRGLVVDPSVKTGFGVILSRGSDRAILTYLGSISELAYEEIDPRLLSQARHLHLGSYFMQRRLRPDVPRLFAAAHQAGMSVSLDTNYDPEERWQIQDVLAGTDLFLPNETELRAISGAADVASGLAALAGEKRIVAAKLGGQGGAAREGAHGPLVRAPALPIQVVDTTGAGDSFDAGFVYGYLQGWALEKSLRMACVCGSLSTRAMGGTTAQPKIDEATQYLKQITGEITGEITAEAQRAQRKKLF